MEIICDSAIEKPGVCPIYDEAGVCPSCGQKMREIKLYLQVGNDPAGAYSAGITPLTTEKSSIRPCRVGFCDACYRAEKETRKNGEEGPAPAKWIIGAVFAAAGLAVIIRSMILNEHEVNLLLAFGFLAFAAGIYMFFRELGTYRRERKEYRLLTSDEQIRKPASDNLIAGALNAAATRENTGRVYLTEWDMKYRVQNHGRTTAAL